MCYKVYFFLKQLFPRVHLRPVYICGAYIWCQFMYIHTKNNLYTKWNERNFSKVLCFHGQNTCLTFLLWSVQLLPPLRALKFHRGVGETRVACVGGPGLPDWEPLQGTGLDTPTASRWLKFRVKILDVFSYLLYIFVQILIFGRAVFLLTHAIYCSEEILSNAKLIWFSMGQTRRKRFKLWPHLDISELKSDTYIHINI